MVTANVLNWVDTANDDVEGEVEVDVVLAVAVIIPQGRGTSTLPREPVVT